MCTTCMQTLTQSASLGPAIFAGASAAAATAIKTVRQRASSADDPAESAEEPREPDDALA